MSRRILAHLAAMRRQVSRIQRTMLVGLAALLPCAFVLLTTPRSGWLSVVLLLVLAGYVVRKIRSFLWTRRATQQLRLEDQFIRHGPGSDSLRRCTRRPQHMWTKSLTLHGLKSLFDDIDTRPAATPMSEEEVTPHFNKAFEALQPRSLSVDLFWFVAVGVLWFWFIPAALLQTMSTTTFIGLALLLLVLVAEVVQGILGADLRGGRTHLATLLSTWTLQQEAANPALLSAQAKPYRHTLVYRAWPPPRPTPA